MNTHSTHYGGSFRRSWSFERRLLGRLVIRWRRVWSVADDWVVGRLEHRRSAPLRRPHHTNRRRCRRADSRHPDHRHLRAPQAREAGEAFGLPSGATERLATYGESATPSKSSASSSSEAGSRTPTGTWSRERIVLREIVPRPQRSAPAISDDSSKPRSQCSIPCTISATSSSVNRRPGPMSTI
jgi:hypothetical protein